MVKSLLGVDPTQRYALYTKSPTLSKILSILLWKTIKNWFFETFLVIICYFST